MVEKAALLLRQARGAYQREQYDIALAYFRRACQIDPHSPEALLGIGEVAAYLGSKSEAVAAFLTLADIYTQAGMLEVAAEVIERVLELDPSQPLARRFLTFISARIRRPTDSTDSTDVSTLVTTLDRPARVKHKLTDQPSETSLAQLVPWAESDDSVVTQGTTSVDDALATVERPAPPAKIATPITSDKQVAYADTIVSPKAVAAAGARGPIESVVIDDGDFADVATRVGPDGLIKELAMASKRGNDPFSAETVVGDVSKVLGQLRHSTYSEPVTDVDPPDDTARGSGQHHLGGWDLDTTAAVMAENVRVKPQLSLEQIDWDESDFPRFEEARVSPEMITRTIALDGDGAVAAVASLMGVSPLLGQLDIDGCEELLNNSEVTQCFAGQIVFAEGDAGSSLFLLGTGQAAVERDIVGHAARRLATLSAGHFFGEGSLLADAPRSSTVRVIEDSLLLELDRALIQRLVARKPRLLTVLTRFLRARLLSSLMMDSPLFHRLPVAERTKLAPQIHLHKLSPGQVVASRGQILTGFCTVMAGELRRFGAAEGTGREAIGQLRPGSAFGSRSRLGEPSPVSIAATTGCWLLRLPTEDLRALVDRHPELIDALGEAER